MYICISINILHTNIQQLILDNKNFILYQYKKKTPNIRNYPNKNKRIHI